MAHLLPFFRRRFLPSAAGLLTLLMFVGCSGRRSDDGKVLHFGNGTEVQDLDPQVTTGVPENKVINALFEGLVAEDETGSGTAPGVAERWENSENGRRWTFHLRPDARWSNGDALTAHDFVRSYQRILTASLGAEYAYKLFHLVGAEDFHAGRLNDFSQVGVKAIDDHTLEFNLRYPTPFLIEALKHYSWFPIHPPTVEKFGGLNRKGTAWTRAENIVGNGPFILESWTPNKRIVVTRSPTYWDRDRVKLDAIHFYPIDSIETEERMFRTGQLHKTNELPLSKIPIYRRDHPESYREDPYYGVYFYRLNLRRPPLNDARVRRALALAIDRESLVNNVTRGGQQPAYNFCPPSEDFKSRARIKGDLETARQLLAEAGFPEGRGFPRLDILYNTSESHRVVAEAIQQMWRTNLGINIGLLNQEWKVYLDSQDEGQYDIARAGWIADYTDPNTFMDMWVTDGGNNDTGFSHAEYDRLLATSLQGTTNEERLEVYQQLEEILAREVPIIPIYFYTRVYALSPKVTGWPPNVLDNRAWKYVDLKE